MNDDGRKQEQQANRGERLPLASLGRIVHFVMPDATHRAAVVVNAKDGDWVSLHVFTDRAKDGDHPLPLAELVSVPHNEEAVPGTWHWPERA